MVGRVLRVGRAEGAPEAGWRRAGWKPAPPVSGKREVVSDSEGEALPPPSDSSPSPGRRALRLPPSLSLLRRRLRSLKAMADKPLRVNSGMPALPAFAKAMAGKQNGDGRRGYCQLAMSFCRRW